MTLRWRQRPEGSNWGDFGPDDQLGRLNLLTPERRLRAIEEVRAGIAFCLSLPLDLPGGSLLNPNRHPPVRGVVTRKANRPAVNYPMRLENEAYVDATSDDYVTLFTQYSTQWDAFSHVGQHFDADGDGIPEIVYYNGFLAGADVLGPGDAGGPAARALGIERIAETCVQGRGVLLDLHAVFGPERTLVGYDELMRAIDACGVETGEGDLLCLHTGFAQAVLDMGGDPDPHVLHRFGAVLDGRDANLLAWISRSGIAGLIADNYAVEAYPNPRAIRACCAALPLHELCLFKLGLPLGELWYLTELATWLSAHDRTRFLLTAPPLRLPGSFGSPVTPVATV